MPVVAENSGHIAEVNNLNIHITALEKGVNAGDEVFAVGGIAEGSGLILIIAACRGLSEVD